MFPVTEHQIHDPELAGLKWKCTGPHWDWDLKRPEPLTQPLGGHPRPQTNGPTQFNKSMQLKAGEATQADCVFHLTP